MLTVSKVCIIHYVYFNQCSWQVFISYGKKSNGELLLSYGFVPKEGSNPSDSVELLLSLKKSDKCYNEKAEALKKHGLRAWVWRNWWVLHHLSEIQSNDYFLDFYFPSQKTFSCSSFINIRLWVLPSFLSHCKPSCYFVDRGLNLSWQIPGFSYSNHWLAFRTDGICLFSC